MFFKKMQGKVSDHKRPIDHNFLDFILASSSTLKGFGTCPSVKGS